MNFVYIVFYIFKEHLPLRTHLNQILLLRKRDRTRDDIILLNNAKKKPPSIPPSRTVLEFPVTVGVGRANTFEGRRRGKIPTITQEQEELEKPPGEGFARQITGR